MDFLNVSHRLQPIWQIINTGREAKEKNCLRGNIFEPSNFNRLGREEKTAYSGIHWVQAFLIRDNKCVSKSEEIVIKIK